MNIDLTFINQSNELNNPDVVLFQKNIAPGAADNAIAWTVIKNCGRGWSRRIKYPMQFDVAVQDAWGNVSALMPALPCQKWHVASHPSGEVLALDTGPASGFGQVEIRNGFMRGAVHAQVYKDGKLLAAQHNLVPQQTAVFEFKPTIWIGVVSQIEEGEAMSSAILSGISTEISLLGIAKANLIMTGGGVGVTAMPFNFTLVPVR